MPTTFEIDKIISYIDKNTKISNYEMISWMESDNIEILGSIFYILDQRNNLIESFPPMEKTIKFYIHYFRRCLIENPQSDWADNRYIAAYNLMRLYKALRKDNCVPLTFLEDIRAMIIDVYKTGNKEVKESIIGGILEHLFEDKDIQLEFDEWKNDSELSKAYFKALEWSVNGVKP
ncbi:MAG: hypothetical protein GY795_04890 [Desulfobacterales bacterium]|nr:hypothetical protein [Desulfobacterales bacterium]